MNISISDMMGGDHTKLIKNARVIGGKGDQKLTLVLSHGYGASQAIWDSLLPPYLSQGYRILLFDWNFSGTASTSTSVEDAVVDAAGRLVEISPSKYSFASFSEDLVSLMDELSIRGAIFVGHSMACMIGCIASIARPDLFAHLVLIAGSPRYLNCEDYVGGFERREVDQMLSRMEVDFQTWAEGFLEIAIGSSVDDEAATIWKENLGRSFRCMKADVAVSLARTIFLGDMREMLEKVRVDCTIVQISNDFLVPISVGHYMLSKIMTKRSDKLDNFKLEIDELDDGKDKEASSAPPAANNNSSLEMIECNGHFPQITAALELMEILDRTLVNIRYINY